MNKRQILASLNDIANKLDSAKLYKEANQIVNVMHKLAMPINKNQLVIEEMSENMLKFRSTVMGLQEELGLFNRVLRNMQDTIYDRRADPEEINDYNRKLQRTFEEIKNYNIRLNNAFEDLERSSEGALESLQERINAPMQTSETNNTGESTDQIPKTNMPTKRVPFSN